MSLDNATGRVYGNAAPARLNYATDEVRDCGKLYEAMKKMSAQAPWCTHVNRISTVVASQIRDYRDKVH